MPEKSGAKFFRVKKELKKDLGTPETEKERVKP